jgi:hypothetical protein
MDRTVPLKYPNLWSDWREALKDQQFSLNDFKWFKVLENVDFKINQLGAVEAQCSAD